jgi:hypothetical protein
MTMLIALCLFCNNLFAREDERHPVVCSYKFSDYEIIQKYKIVLRSEAGKKIDWGGDNEFSIVRIDCNYYVAYPLHSNILGGHTTIIFDIDGKVVRIIPGR